MQKTEVAIGLMKAVLENVSRCVHVYETIVYSLVPA